MSMEIVASKIIEELGGHPRSDESENLKLLANEIIILREKVKEAEESEGRAARREGKEAEARRQAETRAGIAEDALDEIDAAVGRSKRRALAAGTPMHLQDEQRGVSSLA